MSDYVHVCHACANTHGGQQRALGSLDVGITDVCEPPVVDTRQSVLHFITEEQVPLHALPSLGS